MLDDNWDLVDGQDAHDIEVLNYANQINVIEALVRLIQHHNAKRPVDQPMIPNCVALRDLHRTGTLFLLLEPGTYRKCPVTVGANGVVVYTPPAAADVPALMSAFEEELRDRWGDGEIELAAYILWRLNWIHPFKNGNGRTARAFTYACLCLKFGMMLPGSPTVIDLIMVNRPQYEAALRAADDSFANTGVADLEPMRAFIEGLLIAQLETVPINHP